jgi:hypothetical protein
MRCNGGGNDDRGQRDRDNDVRKKKSTAARARYFENACSQPDFGGGNEKLSARYVENWCHTLISHQNWRF